MEALQIAVHWLHVVAAILWVGTGVTVTMLVMPLLAGLPPEQQRPIGRRLAPQLSRFYSIVAGVVFLLGILRGTVFGPIRGVDTLFGTPYGLTWLAALVLTIGLMVLGARFAGPTFERMYADDSLWSGAGGPAGAPGAGLQAHAQLLRTLAVIELVGFAVVITLMILMRFGL
jgi:putative copper export protein